MAPRKKVLHVFADLDLPLDSVTQTFALLARRNGGKTYGMGVMAEEMLSAGMMIVIIDTMGVFWGLKSSTDGKSPGYPVLILGGERADLPLEPGAGRTVADFVVEERVPTILDLSLMGENEKRTFVGQFAQQLYFKNREPMHLFVDEADEFAAQSPFSTQEKVCLGAMQNVVRRGRIRGLGITLATQRSAVISKSVLTQTECLIALQTTAPQDLDAVREWIKYQGDKDQTDEIIGSLPKFTPKTGECYVYSPGWLQVLKRTRFRKKTTFDSSRTPEIGEQLSAPKTLAEVDLTKLKGGMADAVQRAENSDPSKLQARVRQLTEELSQLKSREGPSRETVIQLQLDASHRTLTWANKTWIDWLKATFDQPFSVAAAELQSALERVSSDQLPMTQELPVCELTGTCQPQDERGRLPLELPPVNQAEEREWMRQRISGVADPCGDLESKGGGMGSSAPERMLAALVQHGGELHDSRLAALAGIPVRKSTYRNALTSLRTSGYIESNGKIRILTPKGRMAIGLDPPKLPAPGAALIQYWRSKLGNGAPLKIFNALIGFYPAATSLQMVAVSCDLNAKTSTVRNAMTVLRNFSLIEGRGDGLRANPNLFK